MEIKYSVIQNDMVADFMIVTTTALEHESILEIMKPVCPEKDLIVSKDDRNYNLGKIGHFNVVEVKCKAPGSVGANGSAVTVSTALQDWPSVKGVFMTGICFGLRPSGENAQHRSDVVAAEKVYAYEKQKVGNDNKVEFKKNRESCLKSSSELLAAFESSNEFWDRTNTKDEKTGAYKGIFISGEKTFVADQPVQDLAKLIPESHAGDMEGIGFASSCHSRNVPWLLMKGISDFGGRSEENQDEQKDAAQASALALLNILNNKDSEHLKKISPNGSVNYFFHGIKNRINDVFFISYNENAEPFYHERKIDILLKRIIKSGSSYWFYGPSGIGKSVAITRALKTNGITPLLCDLSRLVHKPIDDIFQSIYENICMFSEQTPSKEVTTFDEISKAILDVVREHYANETLYILLEEIPLNFESEQFRIFLEKLNALIISGDIHLGNARIAIIVSTIDNPTEKINQWQSKILDRVHIKQVDTWNMDDCCNLIKLISKITHLTWSESYSPERFVEDMKFSPQRIKKTLNEFVNMELGEVSPEYIEFL